MGWIDVRAPWGGWHFCNEGCLRDYLVAVGFNKNGPVRDEHYLGGCGNYDIKCDEGHPERRMLPSATNKAAPGWVSFECDCGNWRALPDNERIRNVMKYSRKA